MSEEIEPHIFKKFEILQKLGKGAYGIVWKAIEKHTKRVVALKKVFEAFHNSTDAQRTFREVMILHDLKDHENIVKLLQVIKADNNKDLYLVFEFMETDLHHVIKAGILKPVHKQYIIYQLLKGLKYMQSGDIIHRDLKPSNLLINSECLLKIGDFGLARSVNQSDDKDTVMTEYVATRWYRAPEIVLGSNKYSKAVDMWSVGCILAELINGKALFPGKSSLNQIELILEVIGKPSYSDIRVIDSENALSIINSIMLKHGRKFESFFQDQSPDAIDFLRKCLTFNPKKRMTVEEGLEHPYVQNFHDAKEEKVLRNPILIPIDDNEKLTLEQYREALYTDISIKKKEQKMQWRKKYLKSLGIPCENDEITNEVFRNLIGKKQQYYAKKNQKLKQKKEKSRQIDSTQKYKKSQQNTLVNKPAEKKMISFKNNSKKIKSTNTQHKTIKNYKGIRSSKEKKQMVSKEIKKKSSNKYLTNKNMYNNSPYGMNNFNNPYSQNQIEYQKMSSYYKKLLSSSKKK